MTRIRLFLVVAIALSAGGGLAYATYHYMQQGPATVTPVATRPVIVAADDLPVGAELTADDLRAIEWPMASVPEGAFSNRGDLVGRGLIAPAVRNQPFVPGMLASKDAGTGLPPAIPQGMRAVSVRVNEVIGVAGLVLPGTHVDVLATASPTEQRGDMTSKLVLPNVQVLASGTKLEQSSDKGKPMAVSVVTLLVTPEQSERLTLASTEGKIQLALRNPLDSGTPPTPGIRPAALLASASPPPHPLAVRAAPRPSPAVAQAPPEAPPSPPPTIEMIRGDKRAVEVVK